MPRSPRVSLALLVTVLVAGCGGDDEGRPGGAPTPAAPSKAEVNISDFKFAPETIRVSVGGSITWSNTDKARHTAQTDDAAEGAFDTGDLEKGDTKRLAFSRPGTFSYYCVLHRFMVGTVEVVE